MPCLLCDDILVRILIFGDEHTTLCQTFLLIHPLLNGGYIFVGVILMGRFKRTLFALYPFTAGLGSVFFSMECPVFDRFGLYPGDYWVRWMEQNDDVGVEQVCFESMPFAI